MDSKLQQTLPAPAVPLHRHLQNLWTNFNHVLNHPVTVFSFRLPNDTNMFSSFFGEKNIDQSLTTYEIKNRMLETSVYKIGNNGRNRYVLKSKSKPERDGKLELYFLSKTDAGDLLTNSVRAVDDQGIIMDTPLAHFVKLEGRVPPVSLVPELTQVKNAIQLINKDRKKDMTGLSFSGVPVFQSPCLIMECEGTNYTPAFFRKEDIEKTIATVIKPEERDAIEVSAFEDIIQKMKDNSRSEWNDILFIGPGETINMNPYE